MIGTQQTYEIVHFNRNIQHFMRYPSFYVWNIIILHKCIYDYVGFNILSFNIFKLKNHEKIEYIWVERENL